MNNRIRELRVVHGYKSRQSFANDLHVDMSVVKSWEREKNPALPKLDNLLAMCDLFHCDLDYLTGRIQEPTHEIKFIHERTGLSVDAIKKLMNLKDTGMDDLFSEIITHKNAAQLLRVLLLASDEDEIAWLDLDNIPRELLSSYADKPMDFSVGIGSEVADFLASQEMVSIIRSIRETHEKEKLTKHQKQETHWSEAFKRQYNVYAAKRNRQEILARLEDDWIDLDVDIKQMHDPDMISRAEKLLDRMSALGTKIRTASFAEWKSGDIEKEYKEIYGEE